jgi:methylase of polypeptide subunit release factors
MIQRFGRPTPVSSILPSFLEEADRLSPFVPPFQFTSFFSPEDTLLCTLASEAALSSLEASTRGNQSTTDTVQVAELTTGSGLVGLHMLTLDPKMELTGLDVDEAAVSTATDNAVRMRFGGRARFECADLWADETIATLKAVGPQLIICNPPYVPEPPEQSLAREAGAGPDGTAHLMRTLEIAHLIRPQALALSWCSLSDPAEVVRAARSKGYVLDSLFMVVIADGEYSGSVHSYLRKLPTAFINESADTLATIASDGAARFAYLLMAGSFSRTSELADARSEEAVRRICEDFAADGLAALVNPRAPIPTRTWLLDRWDEVRLRASLHGDVCERVRA